jgi:hypothetical protein
VPISAVRSTNVRSITRSLVLLAVAATTFAAACGEGALLGPRDANLVTGPEGRTAGPSGLEQRLTVTVEAPPSGSPYTAQLVVTSTIVNTGSTAVALTARECLFQDADVQTTAQLDRFEPLISCAAVSSTRSLAPGQAASPMEVRFGVRSGAGTYTLSLRHALSPEFRGTVSFRI